MNPKKLSDDQVQSIITSAVKEAVNFIESEIADDRIKAQKYFDGKVDLLHEDGRSKAVATKCRDTIRAVKPALMRVFLQSDKPVEFVPRTAQSIAAADMATKFAQYVFTRNDGFSVLSDVIHDALIKKVGIAKVYYDEAEEIEVDEYSGLTEDQVAFLKMDPDAEILEEEIEVEAEVDENGVVVRPPVYELKVAHSKRDGQIKIDSIAPEDFFVDRSATSIKDCYVCGHSTEGRVSDLVEMGFDFDEVYELGGSAESAVADEETQARTGYSDDDADENAIDHSMRKVLITEAYMRMDIEGTGVARLYKFICGGMDYKVLDVELCDYNPFAVFEVDPEPHTFFGRSMVDIITDDQDTSTALLRGLLDSVAMMNNPRVAADVNAVNMDDLLNNEIGGVLRTKGSPQGSIMEFSVGGAAQAALPTMQYYDEMIRGKTGVSGAGMGMDADVLQSQTAQGVNAAVQAANAVSELIARTLAEGGMKQLFNIIVQLARQHPNPEEMIRVDGQFMPVDPRSWTADMDMSVNVGLGHNGHDMKLMTLTQSLERQMAVWQAYGPGNGIVTMTGIRNTWADIMALGGVHNADRYINPMNQQMEQQIIAKAQQQAAQAAQGQGDPNAAFLQAEQIKAQTKMQSDVMQAQIKAKQNAADNQLRVAEMQRQDDLQRDQMTQDLAVEMAKLLGQYGIQLDANQIKREQAATNPMGMMNG